MSATVSLHDFVTEHREDIIRRCRAKVSARSTPLPTEAEINNGVPVFLEQLLDTLRAGLESNPQIVKTATHHGHDLLLRGFTVGQVVHDYGDICQSITELAGELSAPISNDDFHTLNKCLDDAIAGAVTEYGRGHQTTVNEEIARGSERLGFLAREFSNLANTALMAFEVLQRGNVGVAGSTGGVVHRKLVALRDLSARSLAEVRLDQRDENPVASLVRNSPRQ